MKSCKQHKKFDSFGLDAITIEKRPGYKRQNAPHCYVVRTLHILS